MSYSRTIIDYTTENKSNKPGLRASLTHSDHQSLVGFHARGHTYLSCFLQPGLHPHTYLLGMPDIRRKDPLHEDNRRPAASRTCLCIPVFTVHVL
jgi:hypothetical protein